MVDTALSQLTSLTVPSILDLRNGQLDLTLAATVQDPDGIDHVIVYYDRPLATTSGAYDFQIIHGYGSDWSDGSHSYTAQVLPHNVAGPLNITSVVVKDGLGNRTTISAEALRGLGVDTSITVLSNNADTTAPALTELNLPDTIDLSTGNALVEFSAAVDDLNEIKNVVIWFDKELTRSYSTGSSPTFYDHDFFGLYGIGADDWSDYRSSDQLLLSASNRSGAVDIDSVWIEDVYGNRRIYSNADLRALGFDTSIELTGTPVSSPTTYLSMLPNVITIREGQTLDLGLDFIGMTSHWGSYSYETSTAGSTASNSDLGMIAGSGWINVSSTSPTNRTESLSISASRDGIAELTETAYLTVQLSGNMTFADGGNLQVVRIDILDDNKTVGGSGNNTLYGTSAAEDLMGGSGDDRYYITSGDRVVELENEGSDTVYSGHSYVLSGNVENLVLSGTAHLNGTGNILANRLTGNGGNNVLNGGLGADTLVGGGGNDKLFGSTGNDTLFGGIGDDKVTGGLGKDLLTGGLGADHFIFESRLDSGTTAAGRDVITDFSRAQGDRINLSQIDANLRLTGDQSFKFIGAAGFSGSGGELRYQHSSGATLVFADLDGDGRADFSTELSRQISLIGQDFLL